MGGGGALVAAGLLLLVLAVMLLAATETAVRRSDAALGGTVRHPASAADAHDGQLVRVSGMTEIAEPARDMQFGIAAEVPALTRTVQMVQWRELPGGSYERGWVDHSVDSSRFARRRGHANPGPMPFHGEQFRSPDVRVGGLKLSPAMVAAIPGRADYVPRLSSMPANLAATFALRDGELWSNFVAGSPQLGDLRVGWSVVPPRVLTVVAGVRDGALVADPRLPGPGYVVFVGDVPLDVLLPGVPRAPAYPWWRRGLALVLACAGAALLLGGLAGRADLLSALALGVAVFAAAAAVCWLDRAHLLRVVILLLVAAVACGGIGWRWRAGALHPSRG